LIEPQMVCVLTGRTKAVHNLNV